MCPEGRHHGESPSAEAARCKAFVSFPVELEGDWVKVVLAASFARVAAGLTCGERAGVRALFVVRVDRKLIRETLKKKKKVSEQQDGTTTINRCKDIWGMSKQLMSEVLIACPPPMDLSRDATLNHLDAFVAQILIPAPLILERKGVDKICCEIYYHKVSTGILSALHL